MSPSQPPPSLQPRHIPTQRRGRETVDRVLEATIRLLERDGFDALTTNKIAEEAGVNVASVYKYFPNKYAIVKALADRSDARQREVIGSVMSNVLDLPEAISRGIDVFIDFYLSEPASAEIEEAFRTSPVLRDQWEPARAALVDLIAGRLTEIGARDSEKDVAAAALVIVESAGAVLNAVRRAEPADRKPIVEQLKRMIRGFLAEILPAYPSR